MTQRLRWKWIDLCFVLASAVALACAFPGLNLSLLAWFGIVPLFLAIYQKNLFESLCLSTVWGVFFFAGIYHWGLRIDNYTLLHHTLIIFYFGLYLGFFGLVFTFLSRRCGLAFSLFSVPFIWILLEYARSNFSFLALPMGLLGHTQYRHPVVIQSASVLGTYGISFLILLVNAATASIVFSYTGRFAHLGTSFKRHWFQAPGGLLVWVTLALMTLALTFGYISTSTPIDGRKLRIVSIQGNIDQSKKWDPEYHREIMKTYTRLTRKAAEGKPDLIVWPETATPASVVQSPELRTELENLVGQINTPLLAGSAEGQKLERTGIRHLEYFNSGILFTPHSGKVQLQRYDKIKLFPFGEYLPYESSIPWSRIDVPKLGRYTPGDKFTLLKLASTHFATTICWENIFPGLVRRFVKRGAAFIVNITNEAHFGKTAAPYQLAAISVFRAVENRRFVVRCSNTGVSCFIHPYGYIYHRVKDGGQNDLFIRGTAQGYVIPLKSETIYTRFGELIVWLAVLVSMFCLGYAFLGTGKGNGRI